MTVDTSNVLVEDPVLLLAKNQTGSASLDAGFIAERGDDTNVGFIWDESDDHFAVINTTEDATDADITIASYANFKANLGVFSSNVTSLGSVGIGTASPNRKLVVSGGSARMGIKNSTEGVVLGLLSDDAGYLHLNNGSGTNTIQLRADTISYFNGGNVGIGTTSPTVRFHVNSSTSDTVALFQSSDSTARIQISDNDTDNYIVSNNSTLSLGANNTTHAGNLNIASDGNVGIGTISPALPLQVSDTGFGQLRLTRDATDDRHWDFLVATSGYMAIKPNNSSGTDKEYITIRDGSNNEKIRLATADDSFFVGGSVGIGTSTPVFDLDISGTVRATNSITTDNHFRVRAGGADKVIIHGNGDSYFNGGSVGIGTTTPSNTLDINGGLEVNGESYIRSTSNVGLRIQTTDQGITNSDGLRLGLNGTHAFLWVYENKPLALATNGAERATILGNGNFGIGTTSPDSNLDIEGTGSPELRVTDTTNTVGAYIQSNDTKTIFGSRTNHPVQIEQNAGAALYIDTSKNVGIGTTSPARKLHVSGGSGSRSDVQVTYDSLGTSGNDGAQFGIQNAGAYIWNYENSSIYFGTNNGERVRILNNGNVGVGTSSPESLLHLRGSIPTLILHDTNSSVSGDDYGKIQWHTQDSSMPGTNDIGAEIKATDDSTYGDRAAILFSTAHNATSLTERMRIASNGNVGIGNTAPSFKLQVNGTVRINSGDSFLDDGQSIRWGGTAAKIDGSSGGDYLRFYTDGAERMRVISGGNVGIGTDSPNAKLKAITSSTDVAIFQSTHATTTNFYISNSNATANNTANLYFGPANGVNGALIQAIAIEDFSTSANRTADLAFQTRKDGTMSEKMRILADGKVGIGTTAPSHELTIGGTTSLTTARVLTTTASASLRVSTNNSDFSIMGKGDSNRFDIFDNNSASYRFIINSAGNVGIGTTSPAGRLQINQLTGDQSGAAALKVIGTAYGTNKAIHSYMDTSNATKSLLYVENSGGSVLNITGDGKSTFGGNVSLLGDNKKLLLGASDDLEIYHDGTNSYIDNNTGQLFINKNGPSNVWLCGGEGGILNADSSEYLIRATSNGSVKLYHDNVIKLETTSYGADITGRLVTTSHIDAPDNARIRLGDGDDLQLYHDGSNSWITNSGTGILIIGDDNGDVRIRGKSGEESIVANDDGAVELYHDNSKKLETTSGGVTITGLLTATTKSFTIDHPTKPGKKLRYGSLEGPENGVYIRGKSNNNSIELPEYWTKLVDEDSITVQLTAIGKPQQLYVERIDNNIVYVQSEENRKNISQLNYYYLIHAERIDVDKLQVEIEE